MSSNVTYRRGQIEWALWQVFRVSRQGPTEMPPAFRTRIKKLLDLDRGHSIDTPLGSPQAFSEDRPDGTGVDAEFTAFDVFCLCVGLDLLDAGFKQAEVVFFLRHVRKSMRTHFKTVVKTYLDVDPSRSLAKGHPRLPNYEDNGRRYVDPHIYMIFSKIELEETLPERSTKHASPTITEPEFAIGRKELLEKLSFSYGKRTAFVHEIADAAKLIAGFLERAPQISRGRKG